MKTGDTGDYTVFINHYYQSSKWYAGRTYVDLLIPGVTEKFIDVTMTGYEERTGDEFGKAIPGVFTDEPNISPGGRNVMRTTPALFEEFQKRWGYDPRVPQLPLDGRREDLRSKSAQLPVLGDVSFVQRCLLL